jgi:cytochrome bd-type quinol oxidase subunit 2
VPSDVWQPIFAFLEHEARFQAVAATATGAAAAWWLKGLLAPPKDTPPLAHPTANRVAAGLLTLVAFLFVVTEGRISAQYGQLARYLALGETVPRAWVAVLVRDVHDPAVVWAWWPYYAARFLLLVVGAIVVWSLFASAPRRHDPPSLQ